MDECNRRHSQYLQAILSVASMYCCHLYESMKASINLLDYEIHPNDLITLLPGTIIQFRERTEKYAFALPASLLIVPDGSISWRILVTHIPTIEQPVVPLNEEVASYLKDYFALLSRASCNENFEMDSELVELSLQTILTSIRLIYHKFPGETAVRNRKRNLPELIQAITEEL